MKITSALIVGLCIAILAAWASSPDPKFNPASFESEPLVSQLMPIEQAATLAQYLEEDGTRTTMLVLSVSEGTASGIDLRELGASSGEDPFAALAEADITPITKGEADDYFLLSLPFSELLASGPNGSRHIGTGTNFPEHADEANSSSVFQFPKFGRATPARTKVKAEEGVLLDYEVELCIRFDRSIGSVEDFDRATKGFFLCGDFTNRNALVHLADPDNLDSGVGFSDAKSGPDFFPTGPFLVVPNDWEAFVDSVRMTTDINGEPRQDARGSEMTLNFRQLVEKAFSDVSEQRFRYRDRFFRLVPESRIDQSAAVMSGTAEGTIFTPPTRGDIIEAGINYLRNGGPIGEADFLTIVRETFIENELAGGHFLQPGDTVRHRSNHLGSIEIRVTE